MEENNNQEQIEKVETPSARTASQQSNVNIQYRKPSAISAIILVLIGAMVGLIACMVFFMMTGDKGVQDTPVVNTDQTTVMNTGNDETGNSEDVKKLDLSLNSKFVVELEEKIPYIPNYGWMNYANTKVTANEITDEQKVWFIVKGLGRTEVSSAERANVVSSLSSVYAGSLNQNPNSKIWAISGSEFDEAYKKVYGADVEVKHELVKVEPSITYEYSAANNKYYRYEIPGGGGDVVRSNRETTKVEANDDQTEIYLYEKFVAYNRDQKTVCPTFDGVYYGRGAELDLGDEPKDGIIKNAESSAPNAVGQYKSTFKLDSNGNYYWVSTEKVN